MLNFELVVVVVAVAMTITRMMIMIDAVVDDVVGMVSIIDTIYMNNIIEKYVPVLQ